MSAKTPAERETRLTLDRREGGVCVVIDGAGVVWEMPEWFAPADAGDGDVLRVHSSTTGSGSVHEVAVDRGASEAARASAAEVLARLRAAGSDEG